MPCPICSCIKVRVLALLQVKDPSKFAGKKSKVAAKAGPANTQWDILAQSDIPLSEIPEFRCVRVQLGVVAAVFQLQNTL